MSKIEELIQQHCPDGVEWKKFEDCCYILDGQRRPITKNARVPGPYPYYGANGIQDYVSNFIFEGSFVLIGEDGSVISQQGTPIVNWAEGKIWVNNHAHIISEKEGVSLRFLYYLMQTIDIHNLVHGNIPKLCQSDLKSIEIPVPPMPVQEEIVRILENFSLLTAELEAELEARRKQYGFYRNQLLSFDSDSDTVQWKKLGEVATFRYGYTDKAKDVGTARYIRITDIDENGCLLQHNAKYIDIQEDNRTYLLKKGDVLVARTGATFGKTLYYNQDESAIYASFLIRIELNNSVLSRYYWHFSKSSKYWEQANKYVSKAGQQQFNSNAICKISIPIPPLEEQQRIVDILDRFDALVNDLSAGLPAEIEARRLQYEYYRDRLLTFKRKAE